MNTSPTRPQHDFTPQPLHRGVAWGVLRVLEALLLLLGLAMALLGAWLVTLGDSEPLGIPTRLKITLGTTNIGGAVNTASGLTFIAAAQDHFLRAFDTLSGELLWEARLPAGGQASPLTYMHEGRQYVAIAAGGHARLQTTLGDSVGGLRAAALNGRVFVSEAVHGFLRPRLRHCRQTRTKTDTGVVLRCRTWGCIECTDRVGDLGPHRIEHPSREFDRARRQAKRNRTPSPPYSGRRTS